MALGTVRSVLVCADSAAPASPCPAGQALQVLQAYVIEPGSASYFDAIAAPYDYVVGGAFWGAAFIFTLTLYLGTRVYGTLINMVR